LCFHQSSGEQKFQAFVPRSRPEEFIGRRQYSFRALRSSGALISFVFMGYFRTPKVHRSCSALGSRDEHSVGLATYLLHGESNSINIMNRVNKMSVEYFFGGRNDCAPSRDGSASS
jgi:hypothetical protein